MQRKLFSLILVFVAIIFNVSYADNEQISGVKWYPFDIKNDDEYIDASYKVSDLFSDESIHRRTKYVQIKPTNYYLYDIPIDEIAFMDKDDYWVLFFSAEITLSNNDLENVYSLYSALVNKLGEPISSSPTIMKSTFDGTKEVSVFNTKEEFIVAAQSATDKTSYRVQFPYCDLQITSWDFASVVLTLTFDNMNK